MSTSRPFLLPVLLAALLGVAIPALAEPDLHGRVVDASGGVVPHAAVTLRDAATGTERQATSDERGEFVFPGVGSSRYTIVALAPGFAPAAADVNSASGAPVVTLTLDAAPVSELVNVRAELRGARAVSTATKLAASPLEIPQTIDSVSAPLLEQQAAVSMQDALRNVTGVSPNLGEGRRDQFLIRGFAATTDMLVDGMRDDALYYRDVSTLERVEVLKGPASALFGRGSSGGVINRVTKQPRFDQPIADLSLMLGSFDSRRVTFDAGGASGDRRLAARVAGAWEDSGSYRDYAGVSRIAVAPSLTANVSDATKLSAQFEFLRDRRVPDRGIPSVGSRPANVPISQYYGTPGDDFLSNDLAAASVTAEHQLKGGWLARATGRGAWYDSAWSSTQATGIKAAASGVLVKRSQYNADQKQRNLFGQGEILGGFHAWGVTHLLLAGVEFGDQVRDVVRFDGTAPDVALITPMLGRPTYANVPASDTSFAGTTAAAYVQDQLSLGVRWKALVGVRGDRYVQALDDRSPKNVDLARVDRTWSPRVGVVFQPVSRVSLYGSISRSFQPSGEGLSLAVNAAELGPEQSRNVETGAKALFLGGRLTATASLFRLDRTNIKTTDPLDTTRLVLVGQQRTDGVELSVDGSLSSRWSLHGGYSFLDATILRSNSVLSGIPIEGRRPGLVPAHNATIWTSFTAATHWVFGGGVTAVSQRFTSNDNTVVLPGYGRVDGTVSYRMDRWEVALNLRNVLGVRYYESAGSNFQIYPGSPRSAAVTVRFGA